MREELIELMSYSRWANSLILDACSALAPEELDRHLSSSFPTILATLSHMSAAERIWLSRWRGTATGGESPIPPPGIRMDELREQWSRTWAESETFLHSLTEADFRADVRYRNSRGESHSSPLWKLVRHVVNHATHHRGQVVTMLRQLGHAAPNTDLVRYYREH